MNVSVSGANRHSQKKIHSLVEISNIIGSIWNNDCRKYRILFLITTCFIPLSTGNTRAVKINPGITIGGVSFS